MNTKSGGGSLEALIDELARVIWDAEEAKVLVRRAGFPPGSLPAFNTAHGFWSVVVWAADAGKGRGVQALVDEAIAQYPGNAVLRGFRAAAPSTAAASRPAVTDERRPAPAGSSARPGDYDVFLSHSSADKPAVEAIAVRLRDEAGLRPFFDKWNLVPGEPWIPALERALGRSTTVAVFFGRQGMGAWHDQESQLSLVHAAQEHGKRVIPVLLPGARREDVDGFMSLRTWVDLGQGDGFDRLLAGITGQAPEPSAGPGPQPRPASPTTSAAPSSSPAAAPASAAMILLFTANASHQDQRLWLEEEHAAIQDALQRSRQRDRYVARPCHAVTFAKVLNEIDDHEPTFVHFSGHGDRSGDLILKDERGEELLVPPAGIAELLEALPQRPTLVTFATCHSRALAQAAAKHAQYAIGFEGPLDDRSAPLFSATLYERLASRQDVDVPRAFKLARIACQRSGHTSVGLARLFEHPGRELALLDPA